MKNIGTFLSAIGLIIGARVSAGDWVTYEGKEGPGKGKHLLLVSGDEEYRSEEALPMLGKILAEHHGFKCTVLFSLTDGVIDPNNQKNITGLENLKTADLMILFTRFRGLPDEQMKYIDDFVTSGKPIIGIRTATHAFAISDKNSAYAKYNWSTKGGFGKEILGTTWVNHWGGHGSQSTRGILNDDQKNHPILKGVEDLWGPTDVYEAHPKDVTVLVSGQVLKGMKPTDEPFMANKRNSPMMPIIWTKETSGWLPESDVTAGKIRRSVCSTIGAATDFQSEGLRRTIVNSCYWGLRMEDKIPAKSNVDIVGQYKPHPFGGDGFTKGVKPSNLK